MKKRFGTLVTARTAGAAAGVLFLALSLGVPAAFAATPTTQAGIVVKNYWGHDMTFNIGDTQYTIPADGQLLITLAPGDYTFSSNVEGDDMSDRSGELNLTNGEKVDLSFAEIVPNYYQSVETSGTMSSTPSQPSSTTTGTAQPGTSQPSSTTAGQTGVLVKNYWGAPLSFNVMDTEYVVPADGQLFIALPAGSYTFSASVPDNDQSGFNGPLTVTAGKTVVLSSYLNSQYTPLTP